MRTLKRQPKSKRMSFADLEEIFEIKRETIQYRLKKGDTLKDALDTPVVSPVIDLTGRRFTRLVAQYRIPLSNGSCKWHCICDCGKECNVNYSNLVAGRQQSCGCLNMERRHEQHVSAAGETINGVKILYRVDDEIGKPNETHYIRYRCICPFCGEEFEARFQNIKSGNTKGCGCTRHQYTCLIDLTGLDFEYCHVNRRVPNQVQPSGGTRVMYECTCICGKVYEDWAYTILHGRSNCGSENRISIGEETVRNWLDTKNIKYTTQYWFDNLRGKRNMPFYFDIALLNEDDTLKALIEYQGEQHYHKTNKSISGFGKYQREVSDPLKREYCKKNNILLFEIAYNENAQQKCEEIYNLLYHDDTVPSE